MIAIIQTQLFFYNIYLFILYLNNLNLFLVNTTNGMIEIFNTLFIFNKKFMIWKIIIRVNQEGQWVDIKGFLI